MESSSALVRLIASGERGALARLHGRLAGSVHRYALATLGDRRLADAIVAGSFVELWHSAAFYPADEPTVEVWMHHIAARRMADRYGGRPGTTAAGGRPDDYDQVIALELAALLEPVASRGRRR